jgi:hypothetical protein
MVRQMGVPVGDGHWMGVLWSSRLVVGHGERGQG